MEYEILGNFDDAKILQEPCDEMEEPIYADDKEEDDLPVREQEQPSETQQVTGPDEMQGAQLYLSHRDRTEIAKIVGRERSADGNFIGRKHSNPMLDSRIYVVEFPDGEQQDVSFNTIAEHLFAQVDSEGNVTRIFKGIVGHQKHPRAINKQDQFRVVNG